VRAGAWPRLEAFGDVTYARPNPRFFAPTPEWNATWSAGLIARWTVGDAFLNDARGDELAANAEATRARRRTIEATIAHEVVTAHLDVGKARAALSSSETAVRAAEEAYRVTTDLYRAGRATTTDLIEAESELLDAKLGYTNARIDLTIAALRLGYATGRGVRAR
jgi:outer membrane protein TolC